MSFIQLLLFGTTLFTLGQNGANALPKEAADLISRDVACDSIDKYSTDWFLKNSIYEPPISTCLFYTYRLSAQAQQFAHEKGDDMTSIWDIWPCELYNGDLSDTDNPLRCIFGNDQDRNTYFENMSRAMAMKCSFFATLMTRRNTEDRKVDITKIPTDGIWYGVEFPTLQLKNNPGGKVYHIVVLDERGEQLQPLWSRSVDSKREAQFSDQGEKTVAKRQQPNGCYSPEQLAAWFDDVNF